MKILLDRFIEVLFLCKSSIYENDSGNNSDVDVFFEGKAVGLFALSHLKNELEQLFGCPVDIVRLREQMNSLDRKITGKELLVYYPVVN